MNNSYKEYASKEYVDNKVADKLDASELPAAIDDILAQTKQYVDEAILNGAW